MWCRAALAADEPDDDYHLVATAGEPWAADHPVGELLVAEDSVVPDPLVVRVALTARAGRLGVLALRLPRDRRPGPEELRLLQTLGRQAGQALDRARFGDRQRTVATTLQHSLLPKRLPDDPRVELSSCYRPAVHGLEVGGDWFDAFLLDGDRVAVVVGDVVGRGLHAAVAMGQLRSAVRALATADAGPAVLLERLDLFVAGVPAADMATVAYAELDLRDGTLPCLRRPPAPGRGRSRRPTRPAVGRSLDTAGHIRRAGAAQRGRHDAGAGHAAHALHRRAGGAARPAAGRGHRRAGRAARVAHRATPRVARRGADRDRPGHRAYGGRRLRSHLRYLPVR